MTSQSAAPRARKFTFFLRMAWRYGGVWERIFAALFTLMAVSIVLVPVLAFRNVLRAAWPFSTVTTAFLAFLSLPAFQQALLAPLYGVEFFKAGIQQRWLAK